MDQSVRRPWRVTGSFGILFVAISFAAAAIPGQPPAYTADPAALVAWFAENGRRLLVGQLVAGLAFILLYFPFFAGLCERLRLAEGAPSIWSRVAWVGAILCPAAGTAAGMLVCGLAHLGGRVSPEVAVFASAANFHGLVVSGALSGIALLGAAVVILRTGVLWRWLGWVAAAIATVAIASCAAIVESNPAGPWAAVNSLAFAFYFLWMAAASVALILEQDAAANV